jgi:hypothetical protein
MRPAGTILGILHAKRFGHLPPRRKTYRGWPRRRILENGRRLSLQLEVMSAPGEICRECRRLVALYQEAAEELGSRSKELSNATVSYEADMFQHLWELR